jgi:hypothetical protein
MAIASRADASAALIAAMLFLSLGLFAIFEPDRLRIVMDNVVNALNRGTWHPYRMPIPVLRIVVGGIGIGTGILFIYVAYLGLAQ